MPQRRKRKAEAEYTHLAIKLDGCDARVHAGINLNMHGSSRHFVDDEEPVYCFDSAVVLCGSCTYPDDRAADRYEIKLLADTRTPHHLDLKIKDLHERDKDGIPRYSKYRDGNHPIYKEPPGIAFLEKIRGENRWSVWVWVAQQTVTDCLLLASSGKQLYASLQEKKENRRRQIRNLSIQTTDPAEE